jgi:hypothetical protein
MVARKHFLINGLGVLALVLEADELCHQYLRGRTKSRRKSVTDTHEAPIS